MALTVYLKKYSLYIIVVIIYFAMRVHALKGFAPVKEHTELNHVITLFPLFTNYLQKLLLPLNLSVCYVIKPIDSIFEPGSVISLLVALAFLFLFFYSFTKSKTVFFVLSCLVGPLMPSLYIPALGKSGIFAERYLYLPSFGFVMLLSFLIPYGLSKRVSTKVLSLFFLLLMVLYSIGTIYRNNVWKDNYTLWTDTIRKAADAALPHFNLGNELRSQGRIDEAIEQYQISLRLEPTKAEAHDNLGVAYVMKGEFDKAVAEFQIALKLNPFSANAYNNLGTTYAKMGFLDKAIEYYKMAIALKPDDVRYQKHLSEACEKKKASDANVRK
jgi:tetratricopeptide (TPR) repeat protein